jgi:hypothetical protein
LDAAADLEIKYVEYLQKQETEKAVKKLISNFDIEREYVTYKKVKRSGFLKKINVKEWDYPRYEVIYYEIF